MSYKHPYKDTEFALRHLVNFDALCASASLDEVNTELAMAVLEEAAKLGSDVLAPLNWSGNQEGVKLTDQGVQQAVGFKEAYQQIIEGGWMSLTAPEAYGGQALPSVLSTAVSEIWNSANMSFALCPLLSQGAIEALVQHGSEALQQAYLPKLVSGEWTGTMNLTEPDAGTDLAAIKTKAEPDGDAYRLSGQKIYITWGDHQMTDNIIHMVLARLPDAPAGVKGISLFLVPKFKLDAKGEPSERNAVECISTEEKLGIHASPTCMMQYQQAEAYLVGEPHHGLACMFTMMNAARQAVGLQGLAISERAYQQAVYFAKERLQGTRKDGSRIPIIQHPDVRRMLMVMKSANEAMRGLALMASAEIDRAEHEQDATKAALHAQRVDLYTPIIKGWLTELAQETTSLNVQVHGGMGFIEETGAAQHYRDARILPIYEGTNAIQGLDFIGRKFLANQGEGLSLFLQEMEATQQALKAQTGDGGLHTSMECFFTAALQAGQEAQAFVLEQSANDRDLPGSVCFSFLMLFGYLAGGWVMVQSAMAAQQQLGQGEDDGFLQAKLLSAQFYCEQLLPRTQAYLVAVKSGVSTMMAMPEEQF